MIIKLKKKSKTGKAEYPFENIMGIILYYTNVLAVWQSKMSLMAIDENIFVCFFTNFTLAYHLK